MNVELPRTRPYGALFVLGSRLSGTGVQQIGSIIVKAAYLLTPAGGADTHIMTVDPAAAASAMVLTDQGAPFADPKQGIDVTREADIAPFKPNADIAVEGFRAGLDHLGAQVQVNASPWLTRKEHDPPVSDDVKDVQHADRHRHLFGYQPRGLPPRAGESGNPLTAPVPDPPTFPLRDITLLKDINGYQNSALNFHRRGDDFPASVGDTLAAGQRITVHKAGKVALSVTLALPPLTAIYRTWCGDGPDKAPYWTRIRLGAMRADTLILRPDAGRAEVIWRAVWPWADQQPDRYRAIRVSEGDI